MQKGTSKIKINISYFILHYKQVAQHQKSIQNIMECDVLTKYELLILIK